MKNRLEEQQANTRVCLAVNKLGWHGLEKTTTQKLRGEVCGMACANIRRCLQPVSKSCRALGQETYTQGPSEGTLIQMDTRRPPLEGLRGTRL